MVFDTVQETPVSKKRRGPKPTGWGVPIVARLQPDLLGPLDAYIAAQPDPKPSRPEALRHLLRDSLIGFGYLPHRDDPEMAN